MGTAPLDFENRGDWRSGSRPHSTAAADAPLLADAPQRAGGATGGGDEHAL